MVGVVIGGVAAWLAQGKHRRARRADRPGGPALRDETRTAAAQARVRRRTRRCRPRRLPSLIVAMRVVTAAEIDRR